MYGVIMAGGQGSRLRPLTLTRPKPMVEILGRPVIDFVKDAMQDASIDTIVVTTGYRGEQLEHHVESWTQGEHPVHAWVNQESTPMGTAGSVRLLSEHLTETFVVGSGDSVASFDIGALLASHRQSGARVTMALWEVEDPTEFGIVGLSATHLGELDGQLREGYICKFKEKPTAEEAFSNVINAGLYIIEPEVLALVPEGEKFDFSKQLFPMVLEKGWPMYAKTIDGVWFDVGHPSELIRAQHTLIQQRTSLPFPLPDGDFIGNSFMSSYAEILGEIEGSVVSSMSRVESGSTLKDVLVMSGSKIGMNCQLTNTVVGEGVHIGSECTLLNVILGDGVVVEAGSVLKDCRIPNPN
ncbi:MAG: NDP-sugar synthase [Candidatus Poseidoniaceae archaeon]|nr:NDP-sugar synthase [Candidatus Poseidoniaceae archaeon]